MLNENNVFTELNARREELNAREARLYELYEELNTACDLRDRAEEDSNTPEEEMVHLYEVTSNLFDVIHDHEYYIQYLKKAIKLLDELHEIYRYSLNEEPLEL